MAPKPVRGDLGLLVGVVGAVKECVVRSEAIGIEGPTTRKRPTSGAPVLPTNGALLVRH